jgi:hypothetical protein
MKRRWAEARTTTFADYGAEEAFRAMREGRTHAKAVFTRRI